MMPSSENSHYVDSLVLQQLQQDDEKALQYLFTTYYNTLYRTGIRMGAESHLTEEMIQGVFSDVWQYRKTLSEIASFEGYLKASLKRRLARQLTRQLPFAAQPIDELPLTVDAYEIVLIEQEENEQQKLELRKALDELTPRQKQVIMLKYFEEQSYPEIAEQTGLQVDTLYKILHEGIKKLKAILSKSSG